MIRRQHELAQIERDHADVRFPAWYFQTGALPSSTETIFAAQRIANLAFEHVDEFPQLSLKVPERSSSLYSEDETHMRYFYLSQNRMWVPLNVDIDPALCRFDGSGVSVLYGMPCTEDGPLHSPFRTLVVPDVPGMDRSVLRVIGQKLASGKSDWDRLLSILSIAFLTSPVMTDSQDVNTDVSRATTLETLYDFAGIRMANAALVQNVRDVLVRLMRPTDVSTTHLSDLFSTKIFQYGHDIFYNLNSGKPASAPYVISGMLQGKRVSLLVRAGDEGNLLLTNLH